MEFSPIKNSKIYEQVIKQIKNLIYEGKIKKGDKLPSERRLKEQLNVSRASIREAFSVLEMLGLISISEAMDFHIKNTRTKLVSKEETMKTFQEQHEKICQAIEQSDALKAMEAMNKHLDYVEKLVNNEIQG